MNRKRVSIYLWVRLPGKIAVFSFSIAIILLFLLLNPSFASRAEANTTSINPLGVISLSHAQGKQSLVRVLDLQSRIICRKAVEQIYWQHTIWPAENGTPKPILDQVLSPAFFQAKVENELRYSIALAQRWHRPITGDQLQAEVDRIISSTRQPQVLSEIFSALDNDPYLVAECLARPVLSERLVHNYYTAIQPSAQNFDQWWHEYSGLLSIQVDSPDYDYHISSPLMLNAQDDTWTPTPALPEGVVGSTAVWTGSEMIIWGGVGGSSGGRTNSGSRYNPATDTWTTMSTIGAPIPRTQHTAVWTGIQMIVWGGCDQDANFCDLNSGGLYDPLTDSWSSTSADAAPAPRMNHTAVWTGDQMIVWGGCSIGSQGNNFCNIQRNDGGIYNPDTNTWQSISTAGAPTPREGHQAVWADGLMLIWGGYHVGVTDTGGRYNPAIDEWQSISLTNAPAARSNHSMVWTGSEAIVWGGCNMSLCLSGDTYYDSGGRYDPSTDSWVLMNTDGAPQARSNHTAIWTGTEMIVWGGKTAVDFNLNTGGIYDPIADTWAATGLIDAPVGKSSHHAIWTGTEMIVWGGGSEPGMAKSGGRYDPSSDTWIPTSTNDPVYAKERHTAVWTGTDMLVWGGSTIQFGEFYGLGIRFDAVTGNWSLVSTIDEPAGRFFHTAVWTGSKMIVWGGQYGTSLFNTGGIYDPFTDNWTPTSLIGAPTERAHHSAVWTGSQMLVWGGNTYTGYTNTGGRYDPDIDSWIPINTTGAPSSRAYLQGVWSGSEMIVWGGYTSTGDTDTGGKYNPLSDSWSATSPIGAPTARHFNTAVWTGSGMIVWGGMSGFLDNGTWYNTGGRYDPVSDTWSNMTITDAPSPRIWHVGVWTGQELIVWGGCSGLVSCPNEVYTGGRYDPGSDTWMSTSIQSAPSERSNASAVWIGDAMLVWGGLAGNVGTYTTSGAFYHVSTIPNTPPVTFPDSYSTNEDMNLDIPAPGVLDNDIDEDDNPLTAFLVANPLHGELVFGLDGSFTYTPTANYNGSDNFSYRAFDGIAFSNISMVTITVNAVNDPPIALGDAYNTNQDTFLTIPAPGVLANDSDVDGDQLTALLFTQPMHGNLLLNTDGSFSYMPDAGFTGSDQFSYQAFDSQDLSQVEVVNITVIPAPPEAVLHLYLPLLQR